MTSPKLNLWKLLHTYTLLVEQNKAETLLCPDCQNGVVSIIDAQSDDPIPALYCLACDSISRPGLDFWQQVEAVVTEFYPRSLLK